MSRENLEAIASKSLGLFDAALGDKMVDLVKANEAYAELRLGLREMTGALMAEKLIEGGATHADRIKDVAEEKLSDIAAKTLVAVNAASADATVTALDEDGKTTFLGAVIEAEDALAAGGFETPNSSLLRQAVSNAAAEAPAEAQPQEMIPDHALHAVARSAIDFLDAVYVANAQFTGSVDAIIAGEDIEKLRAALNAANYLLPGESTAREAARNTPAFKPYYDQDGRGTRAQNEAILTAAAELAAHLTASGVLDQIPAGTPFAVVGMKTKLGVLNSFIEKAKPELVPAAVLDEQTIATQLGNEVLPKEAAEALFELLQQGERITDMVQIKSGEHVMYPGKEHKTLEEKLEAYDATPAHQIMQAVSREEDSLPGVSSDSAHTMLKLVNELRDFAANAEKSGTFRVVRMDDIDAVISMYNQLTNVGAFTGLAALAGRGDITTTQLTAGRDAAAFATMREAMGGGRSQSPERALGLIGKLLPEMSRAEFETLCSANPKLREQTRVFTLEPGVGEFADYQSAFYPHPKAIRWRHNALRKVIRDNLINEKGEPNLAFRAKLMNLRRQAIVAPTKGEARVLREESERLYAIHQRELDKNRKDYLAKASKTTADFSAEDVKRFLGKFEASNSNEPATLIKRNNQLVLEHPEAPTLTARTEDLGILTKARDGYKLHKVDPKELRAAYESGQPVIRMHLEDDRPALIVGHDPNRVPQRQREQSHAIGA